MIPGVPGRMPDPWKLGAVPECGSGFKPALMSVLNIELTRRSEAPVAIHGILVSH